MANKTNCTINGTEYYRITCDIGRDANGKRIRKQFLGKSKKDAEEKKRVYFENQKSGIDDRAMYMGETMNIWLFEVVKIGQIKLSSFSRYAGIYNKYFKDSKDCSLSCMKLTDIKPLNIQRYYNKLFNQGKSSNIIKNANKLLKQFFNYCVDSGYMLNNPCDGKKVIIPKEPERIEDKKEIPVFTENEMRLILNRKEISKIKCLALISYATGMRRGEILGLKESDIDYQGNEIHIRRSLVTTYVYDNDGKKHKETFIDDTKTYSSVRDIPLPESLIPIIKMAINLKKEDILRASTSYNTGHIDMIFLSESGEYLDAGNIDKSWVYFLKRCKVNHKKFHALRHTYATLQFENDKPLLTISKLLGHANIDVTASTYTHVLKKEKFKSVDTLSLLEGV